MSEPRSTTERRARVPARLTAAVLVALTLAGLADAAGQAPEGRLPFQVGERLVYQVRVAKLGTIGKGVMSVEGPEDVRGEQTYRLRFSFKTRVGPVKAVNQSESWVDPRRMIALRFHKHERHPLSRHDEAVEIYPDQRRWEEADGTARESTTDAPLDELSFMYFLRTLPLTPDTVYTFTRHFDPARSPTTVRVIRRETVTTGAGEFQTALVEMRVKDPRRYRGEGVIRINISDDPCRLLVRIESAMPLVGAGVLTLESHTHPPEHLAAHAP
jgi:hypothetical protein